MAVSQMFWVNGLKVLLTLLFSAGALAFWLTVLGQIRFSRNSRLSMFIERLKERQEESELIERLESDEEIAANVRNYYQKSRLAGVPVSLTYEYFQFMRWTISVILMIFVLLSQVNSVNILLTLTISAYMYLVMILTIIGLCGYWIPYLIILSLASDKKTKVLMEIAKLSQRLALLVNDKSDVRDTFLRASRPLKILKGPINEMATMWGKNQKSAIKRFKDSVGIPEVYPLVNALMSLSDADSKEIANLLLTETKNIDDTLESDINRRIENAPLWISFYIMIPFAVDVVLFLYPWLVSVKTQILTSYTTP